VEVVPVVPVVAVLPVVPVVEVVPVVPVAAVLPVVPAVEVVPVVAVLPDAPVVPPELAATVAKDAPTSLAAVSTTVQLVALPEQAPVQPTNVLPDAGSAVKVTLVPLSNDFVQLPESVQLIPAGLDVTVPAPPIVTCSGSS
jgi:hypothetical protein